MAAKTVDMHRLQELVRLHRIGKPFREIARLLKIGRSTEIKYHKVLEAAGLLGGDPGALPEFHVLRAAVVEGQAKPRPKHETSTVEPWKAKVEVMLGRGAPPKAIYDCLRIQEDEFGRALSAVKRFCNHLNKAATMLAQGDTELFSPLWQESHRDSARFERGTSETRCLAVSWSYVRRVHAVSPGNRKSTRLSTAESAGQVCDVQRSVGGYRDRDGGAPSIVLTSLTT